MKINHIHRIIKYQHVTIMIKILQKYIRWEGPCLPVPVTSKIYNLGIYRPYFKQNENKRMKMSTVIEQRRFCNIIIIL